MNYTAAYVLDWFHIAMRFTVLTNTATSVTWTSSDDDDGADQAWCTGEVDSAREAIGRAKWFLWCGNHHRCPEVLDDATETHCCDDNTARTKTVRMLGELIGYLERNRHRLPPYAERHRAGEAISSAPAESAINQLIAKRMVKKQQIRWTPAGAHRLLQIRTRVLDHQLDDDIARFRGPFDTPTPGLPLESPYRGPHKRPTPTTPNLKRWTLSIYGTSHCRTNRHCYLQHFGGGCRSRYASGL